MDTICRLKVERGDKIVYRLRNSHRKPLRLLISLTSSVSLELLPIILYTKYQEIFYCELLIWGRILKTA